MEIYILSSPSYRIIREKGLLRIIDPRCTPSPILLSLGRTLASDQNEPLPPSPSRLLVASYAQFRKSFDASRPKIFFSKPFLIFIFLSSLIPFSSPSRDLPHSLAFSHGILAAVFSTPRRSPPRGSCLKFPPRHGQKEEREREAIPLSVVHRRAKNPSTSSTVITGGRGGGAAGIN